MAEPRLVQPASNPTLVVDDHPIDRASELLYCTLVAELSRSASVRLAIPGGSVLSVVPSVRARLGDAWGSVALTWVDERCVPVSQPESNQGAAARLGLFGAGARKATGPEPMVVLPLYEAGETPDEAVERVEIGLTGEFSDQLDVVLLGMGPDGHVASLFPGRKISSHGSVAHVADSPKPPSNRITLTRGLLATARHVILVAVGEPKRDAIRRLMMGDPRLPAQGLGGLVVVTDLQMDLDEATEQKGS